MPKTFKYPRVLRRSFQFKESCRMNEVVKVAAGPTAYGGVLFEGRVGIKWEDWDLLVEWASAKRKDEERGKG